MEDRRSKNVVETVVAAGVDGDGSSGVVGQSLGDTVDGVDILSLLDHFNTNAVPPWLFKELEKTLLQPVSSQPERPTPGAPVPHHHEVHRSLAAASTVEEQQKIEELLAAPLLPPPDREQLSPRSSPTPSPDEPDSPDRAICSNLGGGGTATNDITRPTYSWAQQHPIAMAAVVKTPRTEQTRPRRVSVRRLPHPRTPDASREASHDPGAWLMQASYAIHGRWLVVDTFYEWKLWMRRLAQQRARTGGLHGLSPPPPGVSWRLRRERYEMLQVSAKGADSGGMPSRQLSPQERTKLAAEAAAAANEHLVRARQSRERRRQQIRIDSPNGTYDGGASDGLSNQLPAGYLQPQQPHPAAAALGLKVGEFPGCSLANDNGDGINALGLDAQRSRADLVVPDTMLMNDRQHRTQLSYEDYVRPPSAKPSSLKDRERRSLAAKVTPGCSGSTRVPVPAYGEAVARSHAQNSHYSSHSDGRSDGDSSANGLSTGEMPESRALSDPLSLAVAELEGGLVALHQMLQSHAGLLLQEDGGKSDPDVTVSGVNNRNRTNIVAGQGDNRAQAPMFMQAAIASAETFADSVVEVAAATGTPASQFPAERGRQTSHDGHRYDTHWGQARERKIETTDMDEWVVTVDPDALIELGPPATGTNRHSFRNERSDHRSHPAGHGGRHGSARRTRAGSGNSPPSHNRSRSRSPPASPIYTVKKEYEVVDPPTFLDLAPRERPRSRPRSGRCDSTLDSRGSGSAGRAYVRTSGKRRRP